MKSPTLGVIAPLSALLSGVVFLLMGAGLLSTLLAVRAAAQGFGNGWIGAIMSSYFAGFLIGTLAAPGLIRRVGHIRAFAFCAAAVSVLALAHALWVSPLGWLLLRGLTGAVLVTLYTIIESWLNAQAPPERRGLVLATYMALNLGALAAGQQLLKWPADNAISAFAVVSMLVCLSVLPVTWTRLSQPLPGAATCMRLREMVHAAPAAAGGALLSGLAMGAFWGLTPVFAGALQLNESDIANLMSAGILGGALLQLPLGRLSDRHDRRLALSLVAAAASVSALLLALAALLGTGLAAALFLFGGFAFALYPVCAAHLIDHLGSDEVLPGTSTLLLTHGAAAACGPLLAGLCMEWVGPLALPLYFAATLAPLALLAWRRYALDRTAEPQPAHFMPLLRTTPQALALLPEGSEEAPADPAPAAPGAADALLIEGKLNDNNR